ncbi:MAG TPA: cytochrome c [Steroidobacteraceae bacterium]|jgi:mono/diheme cytochrome c family protein|nr:cytochrome c [Steroidobacteraceae bacterium]
MSRHGAARVRYGFALAGFALAGLMMGTAPAAEPSDPYAAGHAVYTKWCAPCHDPGVIHPGTNALTAKYQGVKSGVLLEWKDLPPELVRHLVRNGISVMPQFRKTEISDADLDALAKFLARNTPAQ